MSTSATINAAFTAEQRRALSRMDVRLANGLYCWVSWDEPTHDDRLSVMFKHGDLQSRRVFTEVVQAELLGYEYRGPYYLLMISEARLTRNELDTDLIKYLRTQLNERSDAITAQIGAENSDFLVVVAGRQVATKECLENLIQTCKDEQALLASNQRRGAISY